ncbi:cytochrome c551 peroxidase [Sulfuriferula multivorans]|uniref:Cytochrome c551 peroxidase n=1 Tax=Sulfuriferula multivorans TaxID=1559896 RepID=A0A401JHB4_9PROT|nr:cytochrome c peroxidase [Sulfuriferula multivorans]GBL47364.1 cytochrome c551 peroxidase [Sulfuriferula multivorans]
MRIMKGYLFGVWTLAATSISLTAMAAPLGLPPVPIPADNPQSPEKIKLGGKLFHDKRFSSTGQVSCATCHDAKKTFTDSPLRVSQGINKLKGTRNAPTVVNAAYFHKLFWDGREPSLEEQSKDPMVNPVEMGLPNHQPVLKLIRTDPEYVKAFKAVFDKSGDQLTMEEVKKAIASFERTIVAGDSPFDHYYFGGDKKAMTPAQIRGFQVFMGQGRCVSCHTVEQDQALFTDNRFHNIGIGINQMQKDVARLADTFLKAKTQGGNVDKAVLSDPKTSNLGRFAVTDALDDMGSFKTSTLRNIAMTAPYMHDGSLKTLKEVVVHYNNGGVTKKGDRVNDFLSGGIRPLNLSERQISDLVAFMGALTSPEYAKSVKTAKK